MGRSLTSSVPTARPNRLGVSARGSARVIVGALWLGIAAPAFAQTRAPQPVAASEAAGAATTRAELDAVVRDVDLGEARLKEIRREIEALDRDRTRVAEQLLATGLRAKAAETRVSAGEARITSLDQEVARARASLSARRDVLADVLAALQRIGRKPPPAVVVRPEDALASVRSAILIGAVLPELRAEAERLLADLEHLEALKTAAANERDRFRAEATDLVSERARLELLIEERRRTRSDQEKRLDEERRRVAELAQKANSLRDLIGGLATEPKPPAPTEGRQAALGGAARLQPAVAFQDARGTLSLPVAGDIVGRYGEDDGVGGLAKGVSIAARAEARVTSVCDGTVIFAGPFRSYGKLLIINGGGGYHVVLAGMDRIDVELGQFVLAGEPVGVMGARGMVSSRPVDTTGRPVLYIEFRKDSASIDPTAWWARTRDEKVRG